MRHRFKITFQQDQSDCGVACLLSIIQYYGGVNTFDNLRRLSGTNVTGTTLLGLYNAARECGFHSEGCEADIQSLIEHERPCILHVIAEGSQQHYVVCFGLSQKSKPGSEKFIIGDPAHGITEMSIAELTGIWQSKKCLILEPNANFKKLTDIKDEKREWVRKMLKDDIPLLAVSVFIGIIVSVLNMVVAIFSQRLVDEILPRHQYLKLNMGIVLVLFLLLAKEGLAASRQYFLLRQSSDFNIRLISFFYNHLLRLPKPFFDTRKIGELTARLNDTARIQRVISQLAGNAIIDLLTIAASAFFIFLYSWKIGLACIFFMPVFYFFVYRHNKKIQDGQHNIMSAYAITESNYISTLQGIEAIKNNNKQSQFDWSNKFLYQRYQDKIVIFGKVQLKLSFLANAAAVLFMTGVIAFCAYSVLHNELKMGELIALSGICSVLLPAVANIAMITIPIGEAKVAFDRMFEFTSIEREEDKEETNPFLFKSLHVKQIAFRFPGRSCIINDVSFQVKRGEIVAIMGENGCGKTTLVQILQKNYRPEAGSIFINTTSSLEEITLSTWRKAVGIVPQQVHIFNGTIAENIAFEDAVNKPGQVLQFLQEMDFDSLIKTLPQSYMTIVGEEGINLSGGQKQIIGLARALYHKPQLLILDEATASMDRQTELFVLALLNSLKPGMGTVFITHRLHVLKNFCDRIYILEDGIISAKGNHDELLASDNLYSGYWADLLQ